MVIAVDDAQRILDVILKYVDPREIEPMLRELKKIRGNKSYRDTIIRIEASLRQQQEGDGWETKIKW